MMPFRAAAALQQRIVGAQDAPPLTAVACHRPCGAAAGRVSAAVAAAKSSQAPRIFFADACDLLQRGAALAP